MNYGDEKKAEIYIALIHKGGLQVGLDYGFDKVYPNNRRIRSAVTNIKTAVQNNPDRFREYGVTDEIIKSVNEATEERTIVKIDKDKEVSDILNKDIKELVTTIRNKAFCLIDRKLERVGKSTKKLDALTFKDLGIIAGISFDKSQILQGQATENIAVMAKIDKDISPEDALAMVSKMREINAEKNDLRNR